MHRIASPWTLNGKNYPVYTNYLPRKPWFWSVLLYDQPFSRYPTFYNSPMTTMSNGQNKNKKKQKNKQTKIAPKNQNLKFHNSFNNYW